MKKPFVTAIVPAYNEEKTLGPVLEVIISSPLVDEIICVNDGSTDETLLEINKFKSKINIISYENNKGKGYAMTQGVKNAKGEIILFLDADFTNLTTEHIKLLLEPIMEEEYRVVMGILEVKPIHKIFENLTGQRVYYKEDLEPHLEYIENSSYGVETYLNIVFDKKNTKKIILPGLFSLPKYKKFEQFTALTTYLREGVDIARVMGNKKLISNKISKKLNELYETKDLKMFKRIVEEINDIEIREFLEKYLKEYMVIFSKKSDKP